MSIETVTPVEWEAMERRTGERVSEETRQRMRDAAVRRWEARYAAGNDGCGNGAQQDRDTKVCRACKRRLPIRLFAATGHMVASLGRRSGDHTCKICREKERRAAGTPVRNQRINAVGDVWCNACERYRDPLNFRRHPQRPHTWWAYCIDCTRELDRMRWRGERREKSNQVRGERQKQQQANERRSRRFFVTNAIELLRKRGLTKAEICRLGGFTWTSLLAWERGERRVTSNACQRFVILLRETQHLPTGATPAYRRRLPIPGFDNLVERVTPLIGQYPLRSRWKSEA